MEIKQIAWQGSITCIANILIYDCNRLSRKQQTIQDMWGIVMPYAGLLYSPQDNASWSFWELALQPFPWLHSISLSCSLSLQPFSFPGAAVASSGFIHSAMSLSSFPFQGINVPSYEQAQEVFPSSAQLVPLSQWLAGKPGLVTLGSSSGNPLISCQYLSLLGLTAFPWALFLPSGTHPTSPLNLLSPNSLWPGRNYRFPASAISKYLALLPGRLL